MEAKKWAREIGACSRQESFELRRLEAFRQLSRQWINLWRLFKPCRWVIVRLQGFRKAFIFIYFFVDFTQDQLRGFIMHAGGLLHSFKCLTRAGKTSLTVMRFKHFSCCRISLNQTSHLGIRLAFFPATDFPTRISSFIFGRSLFVSIFAI